jgi:type I site-specific restriction endonuclease
MSDTVLGITSVGFHLGKTRKKVSETVRTLGPGCSQFAKTHETSMLRKVADPIADLRRAVAGFRPGQERLVASRGAEVKRTTEPRRRSLVEGDVNDADATARADAAVLALQSASAGVDDALAEVERQLADAQLRLDPERDQAARAAEAIKREKEAEELKQTTDEFVEAGARLAEALRQVTAVSFTASEAAAIVVKAVSEIVEATKVINGELESYVRFVGSGSAPIRRQPMPVTLVETLAPTPTTLPILPPLPEVPSVPLFQGAAA